MPPVAESDAIFERRSTYPRTMISILEVVDWLHEFVIVDAGAARGALLRTIYRLADSVVFVVTNDPASLYASVDRLKQVAGSIAAGSKLLLLMNGARRDGLSPNTLTDEFRRILSIPHLEPLSASIPYCRAGARWPGSGETLRSAGSAGVKRGFDAVLGELGIIERQPRFSKLSEVMEQFRAARRRVKKSVSHAERPPQLPTFSPLKELPELRIHEQLQALPVPDKGSDILDSRPLVGTVQFS